MPNPSNAPENSQRRKFLIGFIAAMGGLISIILGGSGLFYFFSPAWGRKKEGWLAVGPVENLKSGDPQKVDYVNRKEDGWEVVESSSSVWVVKQGTEWVAYDPHCTHLGCPYRWDSAKGAFICPCHGGTFSKEGQVISGPPPRPLKRFSSKVESGILYILPGEEA
jgi:menaquinol-cytochrome c reductase iron-sulfur subunit